MGELQAAAGGTQQPLCPLDNPAFPCVLTLIPQRTWLLAFLGAYPEFHGILALLQRMSPGRELTSIESPGPRGDWHALLWACA